MIETHCNLCGPNARAHEVYAATFTEQDFNRDIFSARRLPDRIHYRMVRCDDCTLLYSNPILPADQIQQLYKEALFNYGDETANLKKTYGRYLLKAAPARGDLLEIGCGNGLVLEEALRLGFKSVTGVEPTRAAIEAAPAVVKPHLIEGFAETAKLGTYDVVAMFQVLDHLLDPQAVVKRCFDLLRPGGVFLSITHDTESWSAKLLGERSPIIDIEHVYLFNARTLEKIAKGAGFSSAETFPVHNTYSLRYWAHLVPMPKGLKQATLSVLEKTIGGVSLTLPAGNIGLLAKK